MVSLFHSNSPPFAAFADFALSLGILAAVRRLGFAFCCNVKVSLRATEVLRCWSSSHTGLFFRAELEAEEKKRRMGFFTLGFSGRSPSPPPFPIRLFGSLLIPEVEPGTELLFRFSLLLLRNPPKKEGISKDFDHKNGHF